jgi:ubiquinone/menaquinone biosynthesis C-methylase UbiE
MLQSHHFVQIEGLSVDDPILQEQIEYYRARAPEYDEWFYRSGRYDRSETLNRLWFNEVAQVNSALWRTGHVSHVLELACGTGIWTQKLLRIADHITAVDASPEMLAMSRDKLEADNVEYIEADLFNWKPDRQYDMVFFAFWLSHVPPDRLEAFLRMTHDALRPGGRLFMVDSRYEPTSTASDHTLTAPETGHQKRHLNDGREFTIVKIFYEPDTLQEHLKRAGFTATVEVTPRYFIYAHGRK